MRKNKWSVFIIALLLCTLLAIDLMRINTDRVTKADRNSLNEPEGPSTPPPDLRFWLGTPDHDLVAGIQIAKKRGMMIRELIQADPEQAIREALTLSEWSALPPEIRQYVEHPFSVVADVEVLVACAPQSSETFVRTELPDGDELETYVYGRRSGLSTKRGTPVQGIKIDGVGVLRPDVFQRLDAADETAALKLYPVLLPDPGGNSVAALAGGRIFYFEDTAAFDEANDRIAFLEDLPGPDSGAQTLFARQDALIVDVEIDFDSLEIAAYQAAAEWSGSARDMIVIMVDFPDISGPPGDAATFSNLLNSAVAQQISDMSYAQTYIEAVVVLPDTHTLPSVSSVYTNDTGLLHSDARTLAQNAGVDLSPYETVCILFPHLSGFSWAGLASVGGENMWLNGNTSVGVVTHELGHNYGARHASTWAVPGGSPVDPAGTGSEYGDFTDIMGSGEVPEGHFNSWHKRHIGWLDTSEWQSVTSSGTYRVYRSDDHETTGLLKGLEIDKGDGGDYWVGLRQAYPEYETYGRGAYLLWKKPSDNRSYLLDMTPQSGDGKYDGGLALGQTYTDASAGIHITPVARGGQDSNAWMDFTVNLGTFPGNSPPSASISGPTTLGVQESALFSVTASDIDGDELAYHWDIGDGLVKPNTASIPVAWLSGSTVTVSCVVSDMKGGTNEVSQSVVLSSPLESWAQRTSGTSLDLKDIALGGGRLVAVSDQETTLYSDNGTDWNTVTSYDVSSLNIFLEAVTYDGSRFIAVGMDYGGGWEQTIYTSPDGTFWTERYDSDSGSGSNIRLLDVAYGNGVYVAVGDSGTIVHSTNGTSWSPVASGTSTTLTGVSYGNGLFVAVGPRFSGDPAISLTSLDGLSWTNRSAGIDLDSWKLLSDVEYCNDRFLGGGFYARILHSTDQGQTFTTSMTGDRQTIPAFAYGGGIYFAAGINGDDGDADINLVSLDGSSWSKVATPAQYDRSAAVYYDGTFITVGDNGSIWQSGSVSASGGGGYATWQLENGDALGLNRDPYEDADFDGVWNLWEYARGSLAADAGSVPASGVPGESGGYFTVSYARDGSAPDVDYTVEQASNLVSGDWDPADTVVVEDSETNLTARSVYPMATQTNEFMRLNIEFTE